MRAGARPSPSSSSTSKPGVAPMEDEVVDPTCRTPAPAPGLRKKAIGVRPWLLIDASGQAQVVEAGKHSIMRRTGLPARDLRILDPLLSYPSTVLGRERAIVINLEHIKAIITAQEVLLLNSKDPSVIPFIDELQRRFSRLHQATKNQEGRTGSGGDVDWNAQEQRSRMASPLSSGSRNSSGDFQRFHEVDENGKGDGKAGFENGPRVLPFEFIALEACLEAACSCLDNEARTLEQEAHPALDKLTSKISTLNLERVRQIKSRLVAITGRVQKVRDELEHLLDDDEDMAEMYLTDKLMQQHFDGSSVSSLNDRDGIDDSVLRSDVDAKRAATEIPLAPNDVINDYEADDSPDHLLATPNTLNGDSHRTHTTSSHSSSKHLDVEELEMLLEAYFVQIDGTLNNLSTLREYVDDTEDYINIMLDDMSDWSKDIDLSSFESLDEETWLGINNKIGSSDEHDGVYIGEIFKLVRMVTDVMEALVKRVIMAEMEAAAEKEKVDLGLEEIKKKALQIETMSAKVEEMEKFALGTNTALNEMRQKVEDMVEETTRQRQRATENEQELCRVKQDFEALRSYVSSLISVRETLLSSEKQFQTMERLFERLVAKTTHLEGEKMQKEAEVQKLIAENVRLTALLDKKEAQLLAMNEQCKFMALNSHGV